MRVEDGGVPAIHIPAPGNPRIALHNEFWMRTREYDDRASVVVHESVEVGRRIGAGRQVAFAALVEHFDDDMDLAIAAVIRCIWQSADDFMNTEPGVPVPCRECAGVAHA